MNEAESVEGRVSSTNVAKSNEAETMKSRNLESLHVAEVSGVGFQIRSADMMEGSLSGECTHFDFAC